jgi:divalent metal cation (Fe/Co/Zn/Cd) transporter
VASLLGFPLLDPLVGLAVAILILKRAIELTIDTVRSLGEEQVHACLLSTEQIGCVRRR